MTATPAKYASPHVSERVLPRTSRGTYNGCRIAVTWGGTAYASLGESTILPDGRQKGRAAMAADLRRMLQATGDPDRDGYNTSHVPSMTTTKPHLRQNRRFLSSLR